MGAESIYLTLDCKPVPWSRSVKGDRTPRRLRQDKYIQDLALLLKMEAGGRSFDGPIRLYLMFDYDENVTRIKIDDISGESHRIKRPDVDNLSKMVMEAVEKSGIVQDDAQVAMLVAEKVE